MGATSGQITMIKILQWRTRVALGSEVSKPWRTKSSSRAQARIRFCLCLLTFGACLPTGCGTPQQRAAHHLELAEHWSASGKVNEAILEYRRAIQLDPKAPAA